jgi:predicted transcriptional regulator
MTEPASVFDEFDEKAFKQAVAEGIASADAGRLIPHEIVRRWLMDLAEGKDTPPPSLDPQTRIE